MEVKQFDSAILKDGRRVSVTDVYDGKYFNGDIGYDPMTWDFIQFTIDDVNHVIPIGSAEGLSEEAIEEYKSNGFTFDDA